jgi:hypothetical protein
LAVLADGDFLGMFLGASLSATTILLQSRRRRRCRISHLQGSAVQAELITVVVRRTTANERRQRAAPGILAAILPASQTGVDR